MVARSESHQDKQEGAKVTPEAAALANEQVQEKQEVKKAEEVQKEAVKLSKTQKAEPTPTGKGMKYFVSKEHAGLGVMKQKGDNAGEVVRFTPYWYVYKTTGDRVKFGYLATDDSEVIERLANEPSVVEVGKSEFDEHKKLDRAAVRVN